MDVLLKGVMLYKSKKRDEMVKRLHLAKHSPTKAVFFTCVDTRLIPSKFMHTNVGDMYVVRNPGALIPHANYIKAGHTSNEPGVIELGCVLHDIKHIIVCGHSDCKAINLLVKLQDKNFASEENRRKSPLRDWVYTHAFSSLTTYKGITDFKKPVKLKSNTPLGEIVAYIDPNNNFNAEDRLSQLNTIKQMHNIASYEFLKERLQDSDLYIHALWFDVRTGDVYYFSRNLKQFVMICEENLQNLLHEVDECMPKN